MPNFASTFKTEITRVARKTIREETSSIKKAIAPYRSEIAALRRRTQALEQQVKRAQKLAMNAAATPTDEQDESSSLRFSAKGMAKHRQRLGLSLKDFGALIGASALSVHKWEQGMNRPRQRYLTAIADVRRIGKREAAARLNGKGR